MAGFEPIMVIRCRHCGAPNEPVGEQPPTLCLACGRPLATAGVELDERTAMAAPPDFTALLANEKPAPTETVNTASQPREQRGLGSLPVGDESPDISALLADVPLPSTPAAPAPFVFGETSLPADADGGPSLSALGSGPKQPSATLGRVQLERRPVQPQPIQGDEATMVGDAGYLKEMLDQVRAAPSPSGWRIKNEKGVVYELRNLDAVVAWLQGKPSVSGITAAQGAGDFKPVKEYDALVTRLGLTDPNLDRLELDLSRASERHGGDLGSVRLTASANVTSTTGPLDARRQAEAPFGLGLVLIAITVACLLAVGGTHLALEGGYVAVPDSVVVSAHDGVAPPSAELTRAITELEAENYERATSLLLRLSKTEDDPRVHRYLALAFHATKRHAEAQSALGQYRRAMRRGDGDHAGQVRPVRD